MTKVLFEVTEDSLETGLRGYPVGYCVTSYVDPQKGLYYTEKPVKEIFHWEPERIIYLLYHGRSGSDGEVKEFTLDLQKRAKLSEQLISQIWSLPKEGDPMKLFSMALLLVGMEKQSGNYREDALNLIALVPEIAAHVIHSHAGLKKSTSQPELGYMKNFSRMLSSSAQLEQIFSLFNVLHYDHGGGNLSVFVAKAVASGLEDIFGAVASGMLALEGKRHGGANQECLELVEKLLHDCGDDLSEKRVEEFVRERLKNKELLYGFGHAVLRVEDPRATIQYEFAESHFKEEPLVQAALLLRKCGTRVLKENPKVSCPYPNVDAISGTLLSAAGFRHPHYFPLLFGLSRTVGIAIQIVYEREEAREGKGTPIVRPKYLYKSLVR